MPDGSVIVEITGDNKPLKTALQETTDAIKNESKNWDNSADESGTYISSSLIGAFKAVVTSAAFLKITQLIKDWAIASIDAASSLQEVQNVIDVTFGEQGAAKIEEWSKRAGTQFGLTELQAKKFTSTIGAMLKSSGVTGDEIVKMSEDVAGLAADMASFYNIDFETAFYKLRSGLSGEVEPLKQLGINLSIENIDEFLAARGSETAYKDLGQAEKMIARYQYLLEATKDAQNDFARTSEDSLANTNRNIETQVENLKATTGKALLPFAKQISDEVLSILKWMNGDTGVLITGTEDQLTERLQSATQSSQEARQAMEDLADQYGELVDMDRESFEPGIFKNYSDFVLQALYTRQQWAKGSERERIDEAIRQLEEAQSKAVESEEEIANVQAQLEQLAADAPDTSAIGAQLGNDLASGLASTKAAIASEVSSINSILSGLGSMGGGISGSKGVNIQLGGAAATPATSFSGKYQSHAIGLDRVPFDGYLASLHEGESILTAEEARIWRSMRYGGGMNQFDYGAMGSAIGAAMPNFNGMQVVWNGQVLGRVIAAQQADSLRMMERSGWNPS